MPIRIQRIEPEGPPLSSVSYARATPETFGAGIAQEGVRLGESLQKTGLGAMDALLKVKQELEAEDAKLDMATKFSELKVRFAQREAEIRESGQVQPKDYAATVGAELERFAGESVRALKYPKTAGRFQAGLAPFLAEQKISALNQGIKLQHAQIEVADDIQAREDERAAVLGATPEEQGAALTRRAARLQDYVTRGIYSGAQGAAKWQSTLKNVEDGSIERDSRSPDASIRNSVIGFLRAGRYLHSSPGEQQRTADVLERREDAEREKAAKGVKEARAIAATEADKMLTDLVSTQDFATARGVLTEARQLMTDERYHEWTERLGKGVVAETDPAAKQELIPAVYNSRNDPRAVDKRLRVLYSQGFVNDKDMALWGGHLEVRLNRLTTQATAALGREESRRSREESRLMREQGDVEQEIAELTRVEGALSMTLNMVAQDTKNWALADLHRNTPLYGGTERPMDWMRRNQATIIGRIGSVAKQRIASIDQAFRFKNETTIGETEQAVVNARLLLKSNRQRFRTEADYIDQGKLLMEKEAILREMQRFQPARAASAPAPGGGGGAAPNRKALGR